MTKRGGLSILESVEADSCIRNPVRMSASRQNSDGRSARRRSSNGRRDPEIRSAPDTDRAAGPSGRWRGRSAGCRRSLHSERESTRPHIQTAISSSGRKASGDMNSSEIEDRPEHLADVSIRLRVGGGNLDRPATAADHR